MQQSAQSITTVTRTDGRGGRAGLLRRGGRDGRASDNGFKQTRSGEVEDTAQEGQAGHEATTSPPRLRIAQQEDGASPLRGI